MNDSHGLVPALLELGADLFAPDRLAPFHLERLGLLAAFARHIQPFVRKSPAHAVEHLAFPDQIPNRSLHHPPRRGGGQENRLLRLEQLLQPRLNPAIEFFELATPVPNHRTAECAEGLLGHLNRARDVKLHAMEKIRPQSKGKPLRTATARCKNLAQSHTKCSSRSFFTRTRASSDWGPSRRSIFS